MKLKKLFALALCLATVAISLVFAPTASANVYVPSGTGASHASIETIKTVTPNGNNYDVHLEAWVTGEITETTGTQPMDIVLVIDQSKSMLDSMGNETRQTAMKAAVSYFIGEVAGTADAEMSDHRMAIVTFDDDATLVAGWTDVLNGAGTLTTAVNALQVTVASPSTTNIESGMSRANTLLTTGYSYTGENTERKQVVVLLTDGVPTVGTDLRFDVNAADAALLVADGMKENGVLVYSIGIFGGAAPAQLCGNEWAHIFGWGSADRCRDVDGNKWGLYWWTGIGDYVFSSFGDVYEFDVPAGNRFLNYISSNYRTTSINLSNADYSGALGNGGVGWEITQNALTPSGSGHYLAAGDVEALKNMFSIITTSASKVDIELDESTVLQDVVTEYFDIVGTPTAYALNLSNNHTTVLDAVKNGNIVSVTGFDYSKENHFVPQSGTSGQKVVMDFVIAPKADFLGGNGVYTNDVLNSGLVSKGTFVENFTPQQVNVPVRSVTPGTQAQTIYLGNPADVSTLLGDLDSRADGLADRIDGTNNAYVNVTYDVKNANGDVLATYTVYAGITEGLWSKYGGYNPALTDCTDYTVTCTVNGGESNTADSSATATVHVIKPVVSNSDTTIYLSNQIDLNTQMTEAVDWTCVDGNSLPVMGTDEFGNTVRLAPAVDHIFASVADESTFTPKECTTVTVTSSVAGNDVTPTDNSFKVHVLEPTVEAEDRTIWLSESVQSAAKVTGWNCACEGVTHTMHANSAKPDETIDMPTVTPNDCKDDYTATYTVGGKDFTDTYMVHVLTADLEMNNPVVYLGQTVTFADYDTVTWETTCDHGKKPEHDAPAASAVVNREASITPITCTPCVADLKIGNTIYTKGVEFKAHVVCPVVTATDAVIKLGNKAPETGAVAWKMESHVLGDKYICTSCTITHNANAMPNSKPTLSVQHTGAEYPTACSNNGHKATAVINGIPWNNHYADYTVHVQTPVVTGTDTAIYLGNETTLAATITGWTECTHGEDLTNANEADPAAGYTFVEASSVTVKPKTCSNYTAKLTTIGGVSLIGTEFTDAFTVHVLVPKFTVNTQDLWADLNTSVDLYTTDTKDIDAVKSCAQSWVYSGSCGEGHDSEHPDGAPAVTVTDVYFDSTNSADKHEIITKADIPVNVTGVAYSIDNGATGTAAGTNLFAAEKGSLTANLHANTFVLQISNTTGQNGIFDFKLGETVLNQLAVPSCDTTTNVSGLYCSETYSLSEKNGWSWRYDHAATVSGTITHTKPGVALTNCNEIVKATISYGEQSNNKWLSGEAYAINNEKGRVDAATPSMLNLFKKKEGDE